MGGGLEDTLAEIISWVALIVVPIVLVGLFWFVHILPEKYAHKRDHPQKEAIKILCVMSLFFGGLLWPIAFVWAFMKTPRVQVVEAGEVGGSGGEEVSHA
jgi:Na+/H+ antiporter NhaD/arsenite permease-like protein